MITLLSPHYQLEKVTENDIVVASLTWGVTIGFGALTVWTAIKQTVSLIQRRGGSKGGRVTPYVVMIWIEIFVCLLFSILCWLYIRGVIHPSFAFYFVILTLWALQVQLLLQIIINRVSVLMVDRRKAAQLKWGVAGIITAINISVYCIWIPARLQISDKYIEINRIWDRVEKCIYLAVDVLLNVYFIQTAQRSLVKPGLKKYAPLVKFNTLIIGLSLSMDVLIISTMSLPNSFVYMQFHPLAYVVKLKIEMSMADLISSIARANEKVDNVFVNKGTQPRGEKQEPAGIFQAKTGAAAVVKAFNSETDSTEGRTTNGTALRSGTMITGGARDIEMQDMLEDGPPDHNGGQPQGAFVVHRKHEVHMEVESLPSINEQHNHSDGQWDPTQERRGSDETPFVPDESYTKVW